MVGRCDIRILILFSLHISLPATRLFIPHDGSHGRLSASTHHCRIHPSRSLPPSFHKSITPLRWHDARRNNTSLTQIRLDYYADTLLPLSHNVEWWLCYKISRAILYTTASLAKISFDIYIRAQVSIFGFYYDCYYHLIVQIHATISASRSIFRVYFFIFIYILMLVLISQYFDFDIFWLMFRFAIIAARFCDYCQRYTSILLIAITIRMMDRFHFSIVSIDFIYIYFRLRLLPKSGSGFQLRTMWNTTALSQLHSPQVYCRWATRPSRTTTSTIRCQLLILLSFILPIFDWLFEGRRRTFFI